MNTVEKLINKKITISAMESCTGGSLASAITDVSGASDIFPGSFVTYSNTAKAMNGVDEGIIAQFGVYSEETAKAMAEACSLAFKTDIGIGVTGTLGRVDPHNSDSVSGVVFYAIKFYDTVVAEKILLPDSLQTRPEMKQFVVDTILGTLDSRFLLT